MLGREVHTNFCAVLVWEMQEPQKKTASVKKCSDYYPFGLTMPSRSSNTANPNDNYKFTGYENDDEGGLDLYHANARGYDPVLGRFMQIDPMASERAWLTPYNYVQNNPLIRIDPTGMLDDYYIRQDGNIDVIRTDDETDTFYYVNNENQTTNLGTFEKNENGLIQLPSSHSVDGNGVSFAFSVKAGQGDKSFIAPEAFAAVLGAFSETGYNDFTITQFSNSDGSSPAPSISHINGSNGDFRYLRKDGSGNPVTVFDSQFDTRRNANFTNALSKYGYSDLKSYHIPTPNKNAVALPNTSQLKGHHNHLHLQGFKPKINTTSYPYIR